MTLPTRIKFEIESAELNGAMSLSISTYEKKNVVTLDPVPPGINHIEFDMAWPNICRVELWGRYDSDVQEDDQGNVTATKHLRLNGVSINGLALNQRVLYEISVFKNRQETFWDDNGSVEISFDRPSPMHWLIIQNNPVFFR